MCGDVSRRQPGGIGTGSGRRDSPGVGPGEAVMPGVRSTPGLPRDGDARGAARCQPDLDEISSNRTYTSDT